MSETETKEIRPEKLDEKTIQKLLKEAQNNPAEAKYLLPLTIYTRNDLYDRVETVYGETEEIILDRKPEEVEMIIIPKSAPTIVTSKTTSIYEEYDGQTKIYVFLSDKGWIKIK